MNRKKETEEERNQLLQYPQTLRYINMLKQTFYFTKRKRKISMII